MNSCIIFLNCKFQPGAAEREQRSIKAGCAGFCTDLLPGCCPVCDKLLDVLLEVHYCTTIALTKVLQQVVSSLNKNDIHASSAKPLSLQRQNSTCDHRPTGHNLGITSVWVLYRKFGVHSRCRLARLRFPLQLKVSYVARLLLLVAACFCVFKPNYAGCQTENRSRRCSRRSRMFW